ncbi:hypothetical protein [Actinomadura latina]|uniref:Uncharacterized protein n=1 Tax=Actinomadura latina TaxID=163603 RepID=A0A846Z582_9ACTN|nr:hypothetical protein [Actinomadura latina]NKZ05553.1 hypothetical protein [Actinomadura latina]
MRMRPRSIRARDTLAAAVIAALVLGITAVGLDVAVRGEVKADLLRQTQVDARRVSGAVRDGSLEGAIPDVTRGRILVQVVEPGGRVTNATAAGAGRPPVSRLWPSSNLRVRDYTECRGFLARPAPASRSGCRSSRRPDARRAARNRTALPDEATAARRTGRAPRGPSR